MCDVEPSGIGAGFFFVVPLGGLSNVWSVRASELEEEERCLT